MMGSQFQAEGEEQFHYSSLKSIFKPTKINPKPSSTPLLWSLQLQKSSWMNQHHIWGHQLKLHIFYPPLWDNSSMPTHLIHHFQLYPHSVTCNQYSEILWQLKSPQCRGSIHSHSTCLHIQLTLNTLVLATLPHGSHSQHLKQVLKQWKALVKTCHPMKMKENRSRCSIPSTWRRAKLT